MIQSGPTAGSAPFSVLPAPTNLAKAVAKVFDVHPYSATGAVDARSSRVAADAEALWNRLGKLSLRDREEAVRALTPLECRILAATARPRLMMAVPRSTLACLLTCHSVPDAEALAWEGWLLSDGAELEFRTIAQQAVSAAGAAAQMWHRLLGATTPSETLASLCGEQRMVFDAWVASPAVAMQRYAAFLDLTRRRMLAHGQLAALNAHEESSTIARWVATLVPSGDCDGWYSAFLRETYHAAPPRIRSRPWPAAHAICETILNRAGSPADGSPFWSNVSSEVRGAFALWMKDRELTEYLGGENERVEFWRRYLIPMRQMIRNREGTVVLLHFDGWVAVQFVASGRATFLFRADAARGWRLWTDSDLYRHVLSLRRAGHPSFLDSYEQRGYTQTWQATASDTVEQVLRTIARDHSARARA